jgi:signal transduction histidine kinase/CheY-like chemotaxis protein
VDETTKGTVAKLAALERLVREMSIAREAKEIYEPVLAALDPIIGARRSSILLLDEQNITRFVAWHDLSEAYRNAVEGHFPWPIGDPNPQRILIADVTKDPTLVPFLPLFEHEGIGALAFVPLIYRDRLVGKLMLYFAEPHAFADDELEFVNTLASLVAFAIERTRLYAELAESDRRKDIFLATLGHELRNPLAPISAALAVMNDHPNDFEVYRKLHAILDRSVRQIVQLVEDLLDVSRITRGMIAIDKVPVDLASIIHHAILPIQPLIAAQHQELTLSVEPVSLSADPLRLEQVITNLVHNASKYTQSGGHIRVAAAARNGGVEIKVSDDGIGLDPEVIPRLFDLFVQVDKSLARTRGGLGVGLTIVRELVHLHGGTITAKSEGVGKGSEFTIWLPGRIAAAEADAADHRHTGPSRKILVVDDNEDAAVTLAMLLEDWGHEVTTALDGETAIKAVAEHHPQVVLLDLGLPDIDGYEVATRLRKSDGKDLRIFAVSGYGQPEDVARARSAGCDAHLAKPVDVHELERLLDAA